MDLSLWTLKDNDDTHVYTIPEGTNIAGEGFVVAVKDAADYTTRFPDAVNYIGELGFGLGSSGDSVRLYDSSEILQDQVSYTSESPWPSCANDTGYTLELKDPELDNSIAQNWDCINLNGSPNAPNIEPLSSPDTTKSNPVIFPNPTRSVLNIIGNTSKVDVTVYNVAGQKLIEEKTVNQINVATLKSGVYFIKIHETDNEYTLKFLKN